jgi:DNA-binding IclR family transcriptional regulator
MTIVDSETAAATRTPRRDPPPSMLERMTLILDAFDGPASRRSLEQVALRTRLPRSTVHRILDQLVRLHWIERTSFGYRLGRRAIGLGGDDGHGRLREAAAPVLHDLHLRTAMVVHLTVLDGGHSVYLDKIGGRFAAELPSRVGGRAPAHATAGGKAMLAWMNPEAVDELYPQRPERRTERTITDLPALHQELNRIRRRNGLAFEYGESAPGIACAGAAVRDQDGPVAGISLCGAERGAQLARVAPLVAQAAREVTRRLYPEAGNPRRDRPEPFDGLRAVPSGQWNRTAATDFAVG